MEELKNKKVSFVIILLSVLMIVFGIISKDYNGGYYSKKHKTPPLDLHEVNLFGLDVSYKNFMLFFIITLGIGIYMLIYKTDKSTAFIMNKIEVLKKIKLYTKNKNRVTITNKSNKITIPKIVEALIMIALIFTFSMAISKSYSLWFFVILTYYYYLILTPKSYKEIAIKAIFYPMIFLFIFAFFESKDIYNMNAVKGSLSRQITPYFIAVLIMFFSLRIRMVKNFSFSYKSPLFWSSALCFVASILRFIIDKELESSF